jgi:hypothetical protein
MISNKQFAMQWIEASFLSEELKEMYLELMDKRYSQIVT